jgi:hypothetical protein
VSIELDEVDRPKIMQGVAQRLELRSGAEGAVNEENVH